jgi:hypothetical protein
VPRAIVWQLVLLLPHPILTILYLLAVRSGGLRPSFVPVVALMVLPLLSAGVGLGWLRVPESAASRGGQMVLLALAALEVSFTVFAMAVVGFAIGFQSL